MWILFDYAEHFLSSPIANVLLLIMLTVVIIWFYFRDTANGLITWGERRRKRKMAEKEVQKCLDWLLEQKEDLESSPFGSTHKGIIEALKQHRTKSIALSDYKTHLEQISEKHKIPDDDARDIAVSYKSVQALSDKRSGCFTILSGIAGLEDHVQELSTEFDTKVVHLKSLMDNNKEKNGHGLSNESLARTTQNCVVAMRQNWKWINEVMQCAHVHLGNAATYQEFFHEVEEVEYWMNTLMSRMHMTFSRERLQGDTTDSTGIQEEMKDTLMAYLRWQSKVENIMHKARDVVPVEKRIMKQQESCPVVALTGYKTSEIQFSEGDTLKLLDNSDRSKWLVENDQKQRSLVPAVILLIPAPDSQAVDVAIKLKLQLLGLWTTSLKRLGFQMIAFMQLVFKDWNEDEIKILQCIRKEKRDDILRVLALLEEKLQKNWSGYEGFKDLQEKISRLRTILEEAEDGKPREEFQQPQVVVQVTELEDILNKYQDFWTYWDTYRVVVELVKQPKYLLVCDKWDQLKFVTSAHFVRFWDTTLQLDSGKTDGSVLLFETPKARLADIGTEDVIQEEVVEQVEATRVNKTPSVSEMDERMKAEMERIERDRAMYSSDFTEYRNKEETRTDEVMQSMQEVRQTFIIKSVWDTLAEKDIGLEEAIMRGIIDQAAGTYTSLATGDTMTLQQAVSEGCITVQITSKKTLKEERQSYGIVTIKTTKETRPYTIVGAVDPSTEEEVDLNTAIERGILTGNQTYRTENGEEIDIMDAIQSGLVKAEFHGSDESSQTETKTYAISSVVDQRRMSKVPFDVAVKQGLLDSNTGMYINNKTGEKIGIMNAIMRGMIKARVVTDTSTLDINPENQIVVERLGNVKSKVLKAVKVVSAFQNGR